MSDIRFNRWLHQSGTGGVYQDSTGSVGIGTSVPTSLVDIQGGNLKIGNQIFTSTGVSTFSSGLNVTGGSVGIGTTNPQRLLHLYSSSNNPLLIESPDQFADIVQADTGGSTRLRSDQGGLRFYTGGDASSVQALNATERLGITSTGDVNVAAGSSVFIANGNLVFSSSGTGIDFQNAGISSTTATAHILDDYEEGTFTVTYFSTTGPTDLTMSSINDGVYTKIGRVVNFNFRIATSELTSFPTGDMRIRGLPFAVRSSTQQRDGGGAVVELYRWATNFVSANNLVQVSTINGTDQLRLMKMSSTTSSQVFIDETDMNTGTNQNIMAVCGHYYTDE